MELYFCNQHINNNFDIKEHLGNNLKNINTIKILNCSHNKITNISFLPDSLNELDCSYNLIKNLSNLPENLKKLICSSNRINELKNLPQNLCFLNK
jgi:Leucine-rich repeat (LRR) protein